MSANRGTIDSSLCSSLLDSQEVSDLKEFLEVIQWLDYVWPAV